MLTGELRSKVDKLWTTFWTGGIANPLTVIEQISYLLFLKRLDDLEHRAEKKALRTGKPNPNPIFSAIQQHLRWSRFSHLESEEMFKLFQNEIFPFMKELATSQNSTFARAMKDAVFLIPKASLIADAVDMIAHIPMEDRDTKGDLYEYMLGKLTTAGTNGQFRTPRHIIKLMVAMMEPTINDRICDPACGTTGFLVGCIEHLIKNDPDFFSADTQKHINGRLFNGFDFDTTMLRIGSMNMMLHGVENPNVQYKDSLSKDNVEVGEYTLIVANPPFKGSLAEDEVAPDLLRVCDTKKTELLFLALMLRLLTAGGRCAVIVPDGVLFGSSKAHKAIRQTLVEKHKLEAVVSLPSGVFKPYAGVSTAILYFTKTGTGGTDGVWFYDMEADGWSLDDKRTPLLKEELLGPTPERVLKADEHTKNNLPDVLARWKKRDKSETKNLRTAQSFVVPKAEIVGQGYDLSISRYKEVVHEEVEHVHPDQILDELDVLNKEIAEETKKLRKLIKEKVDE
jgi:type I restriction enzyme M protein